MNLSLEQIHDVIEKSTLLYTAQEVEKAIDEMALKIEEKFTHSNLLCMTVMIGGLIPTGALLRRLHFPIEMDYVHATRYTGKTRGGELTWLVKPQKKLKNRTILIVDDILDGGITLAGIVDYCKEQGAKEVYTAVLIDKQRERPEKAVQKADFAALEVENKFIYGYGMDYGEYLRNAPGIYAVAKEHE